MQFQTLSNCIERHPAKLVHFIRPRNSPISEVRYGRILTAVWICHYPGQYNWACQSHTQGLWDLSKVRTNTSAGM